MDLRLRRPLATWAATACLFFLACGKKPAQPPPEVAKGPTSTAATATTAPVTAACDEADARMQQCQEGRAGACLTAGDIYRLGRGVTKDAAHAARLYDKGCTLGDVASCTALGFAYLGGEGVKADVTRGVQLFQRACEAGSARACGKLGEARYGGVGGPKDREEAARLWRRSCDGHDPEWCFNLGVSYQSGEVAGMTSKDAAPVFQIACDGEFANACNDLGLLYLNGRGVAKDPERGAALLQRGCGHGSRDACTNLGNAYARGDGVPKDEAKAREVLKKTCENERVATGCYDLALTYLLRNDVEAVRYAERGCELGSAAGCRLAGGLHASGQGTKRDYEKARGYYTRACKARNDTACKELIALPAVTNASASSPSTASSTTPIAPVGSASAAAHVACTPALAGKGLPPMKQTTTRTSCPDGYATFDAGKSGPPGAYAADARFCYLRCASAADCCGWGYGEAYCKEGQCAVR